MKRCRIYMMFVLILLLLMNIFNVEANQINDGRYLSGEYWKKQGLNEIIPFWAKTVDYNTGGYFSDVLNDGKPTDNLKKYPRMVSRMVYAFCTAYLLSGKEKYLKLATHGMNYLKKYGWDHQYGGWVMELGAEHQVSVQEKEIFDEAYGNLGPIFYYYLTHDEQALKLVTQTHYLIKTKAWDFDYQGYYATVNRDWSLLTTEKSFNSQIDLATGYLCYYYLVTKDPMLLKDLKQIGDLTIENLYNAKSGYLHERYTRKWDYIGSYLGNKDQIDLGHNMKAAWFLLRLYQLTQEQKYYQYAKKIYQKMITTAWDKEYYGWYFTKNAYFPAWTTRDTIKCWWTQCEGNFMLLNLYQVNTNTKYLDYFKQSSQFWERYFIDHRYGEVFANTYRNGKPKNELKGQAYKSGYHTMENALMNYLYLNLYVNHGEAELYFKLKATRAGSKHYVKIVEGKQIIIKKVELNGKSWKDFDARKGSITLPRGVSKVKVVLGVVDK